MALELLLYKNLHQLAVLQFQADQLQQDGKNRLMRIKFYGFYHFFLLNIAVLGLYYTIIARKDLPK